MMKNGELSEKSKKVKGQKITKKIIKKSVVFLKHFIKLKKSQLY